jgi:hypothetical protein
MESSRDSSVWRNLAVTFGGGLALGAVGMKITQSALRPAESPSRPAVNPVTNRLTRMEQRLERVEQAPVSASPAGTAQLDQKVLEAVVGAVDARLHEHSAQVERRLADLDARITVELQALHQQDRTVADTTGKDIEGLRHQFLREVAGLRAAVQQELGQFRESVSKTVTDEVGQVQARVAAAAAATAAQFEEQLAPLRAGVAQVDTRVAAAVAATAAQFEEQLAPLRADMAQVDTRVAAAAAAAAAQFEGQLAPLHADVAQVDTRVAAAAAAAAAQFEQQLAPLRAEVERKESELAELRRRLTESEGAVLDVVLAIGQVCRQAAERIGGPGGTRPAAGPPTEIVVPAPAPAMPPDVVSAAPTADAVMAPSETQADAVEPASTAAPVIAPNGAGAAGRQQSDEAAPAGAPLEPGPASNGTLAQGLPDFLQPSTRSRWRMPLVSSLFLTTCAVLLVRYL